MGTALATSKRLNRPHPPQEHNSGGWDFRPHGVIAKAIEFSTADWGEVQMHPVSVVRPRSGPSYNDFKNRITEMEHYGLEGRPNRLAISLALYALQLSHAAGILPRTANPTADESLVLEYVFGEDAFALDFYNTGEIVYVERRKGCRTSGAEIEIQNLEDVVKKLSRYARTHV